MPEAPIQWQFDCLIANAPILDAMRRFFLRAPGGEQVALNQSRKVEVTRGPEKIEREEGKRRIVVMSNVEAGTLGFVSRSVRGLTRLALPPGYFIEYGGQIEIKGGP